MTRQQPSRVIPPPSPGERRLLELFAARGWQPLPVQRAAWAAYGARQSGLVYAPTGVGKTLAVWGGPLIDAVNRGDPSPTPPDLRMLWLTPMRALASDTRGALEDPLNALGLPWTIGVRTGDTPESERRRQRQRMPTVLVITPESLALLMTHPGGPRRFCSLETVVVDEWHELLGSKRGVMTELLLARLRAIQPSVRVWGLSATLGNVDAAMSALLGRRNDAGRLIRDTSDRAIRIASVMPDVMDRFPWAGHLGLKLLDGVLTAIDECRSTLVFTNTRAQAEQWYQAIVTARPQWAPCIGLHHGSISKEARIDVEAGLSAGRLKAVVCTSSLDLGVDFSPVDQVIQVGSPKGIARFMQRAGRSGHHPGGESLIRFVPSHAFELVEIAAVRKAIEADRLESRPPLTGTLDVLAQHMVTLALGDGFTASGLFEEIHGTAAFRALSREAFDWTLGVVTDGGDALAAYPDYRRLECDDGYYRMTDRRLSSRHRMNIGTISDDPAVRVQYRNGRPLGTVEESFAAKLKPGGRFVFSGKTLQVVRFRDGTLFVRKARTSGGVVPRWLGGRMPLSTDLAEEVRAVFDGVASGGVEGSELAALFPVFELQSRWSALPAAHELLVEGVSTREGQHLFFFPFEGRRVHEGLAALLAYRFCRIRPMTVSYGVNDYGLELLSNEKIPIDPPVLSRILEVKGLDGDLVAAVNAAELEKRHFREIARIAGLVVGRTPGRSRSAHELQASAGLIHSVLKRYDPANRFLAQARREVMDLQLERERLGACLMRLALSTMVITRPPRITPLAFPIMADRLRGAVSSETLSDRLERLLTDMNRTADLDEKG